jgi:membrane protease YdiL (CAAX protease family)
MPLSSLFVPGLGEYLNGQTDAGLVFTGVGVFGIGVFMHGLSRIPISESNRATLDNINRLSDPYKEILWGAQTYQNIGMLSTYHTFRSVVEQQKQKGRFAFVTVNETPGDLMLAPFDVRYLARPTTFIPIALLGAYISSERNRTQPRYQHLTLSDGLFTLGTSYNAGVGEEAFFRGYFMMNFRESWQSDFWSNAATAVVFGAAHISPGNPYPVPQTLIGFYLGWLAQHNHYTLAESIFLHTWWDIIAIGSAFAESGTVQTVWLPVFATTF